MTDERNEAQDIHEYLESLDPGSRTFYAEAALGRSSLEFFKSDLGRYIAGCCQQERDAAIHQLKQVSPWRRTKIRQLQNEIWRAESFVGWLNDLILQGKAAEQALDEREE